MPRYLKALASRGKNPRKGVSHCIDEMVTQRVYQIVASYNKAPDAVVIAIDPTAALTHGQQDSSSTTPISATTA